MASLDSILNLSTFNTTFFYEKLYVILSDAENLVSPYSLAIGLVTILGGFVGRRYSHRYFLIVAVACGYAAGLVVSFIWPQPLTELEYLGRMPLEWLPLNMPTVNIEYLMTSIQLIPYAVTIAFIGLAQSLVIVRELKMTTDQAIDLDKEVYAQGMANFLAPFFSTFAGSGSFNRSKANRSLGASTPLSGIVAAGFVLLLITFPRADTHLYAYGSDGRHAIHSGLRYDQVERCETLCSRENRTRDISGYFYRHSVFRSRDRHRDCGFAVGKRVSTAY
jgi:SulP family sulfate permease